MATVRILYDAKYYNQFDNILEQKAKEFKLKRGSSGMGFGQRDIVFESKNYENCLNFAKSVKKLKEIDSIEILQVIK